MEGPRPLCAEELPSLVRLLNRTFRANFPGNFLEEYPHILNEANLGRLIVMSDRGEIVSHVGVVARQISFEGVPLAAALIGAVATAEECRGSGCATRCLDFALDQAVREGCDFAWISGGRGLYTSRGAAVAGREWIYQVAAGRKLPEGLTVREFSISDNPAAVALYEREPVHFLRERDDWSRAAKSRFVLNSKSRFWGAFRSDRLCAYLIVHEPRPDRPAMVLAEFAGDRMDAARATPEVVSRMGGAAVEAHVGDWDRAGREAFAAVALTEGKLEAGRGTFLPLRMVACMEKLRPRIARLCGQAVAGSELRFSESGEGPDARSGAGAQLHISLGPDEARIAGRAQVARFLFGAPDPAACSGALCCGADSTPPAIEGAASVIEKLQPAFPLPTPWYGLNYV